MFPIVLIRNNCRWASYWELALLQPFGEQVQAGAVPEDQLHSVGSLARKQKITRENGSTLQLLLHQRRKPVHPFAEVHRLGRPQNADLSSRNQHSAAHALEYRTARSTVSTSRASAPPGLHLVGSDHDLDGAERRSCAAACSP